MFFYYGDFLKKTYYLTSVGSQIAITQTPAWDLNKEVGIHKSR